MVRGIKIFLKMRNTSHMRAVSLNILAKFTRTFVLSVVLVPLLFVESAKADVAARIDVAGRQAMLSMRMAMTLCLVQSGANENYKYAAQQAIQIFDKSLNGLLHGKAFGIDQPERNRPVLTSLNHVAEMWFQLGPDYWEMSVNRAPSEIISEMIDENILLMQASNVALSEVEAVYGKDHPVPSSVPLLSQLREIRVHSQRAVKEACFAAQGFRATDMLASLGQTLQGMDAAMQSMQGALAKGGITEEAKAAATTSFAKLTEMWSGMRSDLQAIYEQGASTKSKLDELGQSASNFLGESERLKSQLVPAS